MLYVPDTYNSELGIEALPGPQQQHHMRHKPVKRQASELGLHSSCEIQAQTADVWAQQQMNWVQMWPENGYQHAPQHSQMPWMSAGGPAAMSAQQLSAQSMSPAMHMQPHCDPNIQVIMLSHGYGHGKEQGAIPGAVLGFEPAAAAAARPAAAADATPGPHMPAPQHRLPKRRASAPHLMPAAAQQQNVFKCVPHVGGPDCPCTTCLCARTDELCQRILQQRNAQAAPAVSASTFHSSRAPAGGAAPMQPRASSQHRQQQAQAAGLGQSPVSCKRRSFELPPAPKTRRSPEVRQSSNSPSNAGGAAYQQPAGVGSLFAGYAATSSPPMQAQAAAGQCLLAPAGSGPLRGQFQALSVSGGPFEHAPEAYMAANAAAAQAGLQRSMAAAGPGLPEAGSGHSGIGSEDEAAIDQELEQMLAQIAWPGQQSAPAQQQHRPQHMHHRSLPHTLQQVHMDEALQHQMTAQQASAAAISNDAYARAAALPAAAPPAQGMYQPSAPPQQQQQHLQQQAGPAAGGSAAVPACPDLSALQQGWAVEQSGASFDNRGPCQVGDPDELLVGCPGSPDLALLGDFLGTSPEEASLVDLLLN